MDEDVVDADAGLPAVQEFTKKDAVYSCIDLGSLVDNHGAFASELKNTGDQIFCSFYGH